MSTSTLTSKGQTTVPKDIRRHLGLKPGDKIRFLVEDDGRVVILPATLHLRDLRGSLPKPSKPVSVERMNAAIRKRAGRS
ncbi:MAG: type II toxin-antitoxin system PrlF family antitoxin [Proteobacteria bacterium]|nr:type II toxin-antitoxin system PrlF family antitoxin [Pseudomonadota bacterium]